MCVREKQEAGRRSTCSTDKLRGGRGGGGGEGFAIQRQGSPFMSSVPLNAGYPP